jgi:hypothetical protein
MNVESLIEQICAQILNSESEPDILSAIAGVLEREGFDIRREPSLPVVKHILVEAVRAANEWRCVSC